MPIDPRDYDPFRSLKGIPDLDRLMKAPHIPGEIAAVAQSLTSIVPPLSALDRLMLASPRHDPATAKAIEALLAKPSQSALDSIASAKDWLQSVSNPLTERVQQLITQGIGLLGSYQDIQDAVAHLKMPKWQRDLIVLSTTDPLVPPDLTAALSKTSGLYAGIAKSSIADLLARAD